MIAGLAFAAASVGFSSEAAALETVPKGTLTVGAERLTGMALHFFNGSTEFSFNLLHARETQGYQYPRIGVDYFVADGLSIGGNVGISYNTLSKQASWAISPRVGYAFAIGDQLNFWPRLGIGWVGRGDFDTAVITLDATFVYNVFNNVGFQFGPTLDAGLANNAHTDLGASAGLLMSF